MLCERDLVAKTKTIFEVTRAYEYCNAADFWRLSQAGRALAEWHLHYETVTPYPATLEHAKPLSNADYRVTKMRYGKDGKDKDRTTIHYNEHITVRGIPLEAYDYVVNGKSAIDWVVERHIETFAR